MWRDDVRAALSRLAPALDWHGVLPLGGLVPQSRGFTPSLLAYFSLLRHRPGYRWYGPVVPKSPILPLAAAVTAVALSAAPAQAAALSPGKRDEVKVVAFPLLAVKGQTPASVGGHVSHSSHQSHVSGSGRARFSCLACVACLVGPCPVADERCACRVPAAPASPAASAGSGGLPSAGLPSGEPAEQLGGPGERQPGDGQRRGLRVRHCRAVQRPGGLDQAAHPPGEEGAMSLAGGAAGAGADGTGAGAAGAAEITLGFDQATVDLDALQRSRVRGGRRDDGRHPRLRRGLRVHVVPAHARHLRARS